MFGNAAVLNVQTPAGISDDACVGLVVSKLAHVECN